MGEGSMGVGVTGGGVSREGDACCTLFGICPAHAHSDFGGVPHSPLWPAVRRRCHLRSSHSRRTPLRLSLASRLSQPTSQSTEVLAPQLKTHLAVSVLVSQQLAFVVFGSPLEKRSEPAKPTSNSNSKSKSKTKQNRNQLAVAGGSKR